MEEDRITPVVKDKVILITGGNKILKIKNFLDFS